MIDEFGSFCFGEDPTMADRCLIPQLFNARRFGVDLSGLERLATIDKAASARPDFDIARPEMQVDAE